MSDDAPALTAGSDAGEEPLSWENLGAQPAGRAFRESTGELLAHPDRFFRKMAVSGGLHEPLTFFALVLAVGVVLAFPAALACFGLSPSDPAERMTRAYQFPAAAARWTGFVLVLLPVVLMVGSTLMVLLGTLFHVAGKPFGARNWEGSVSVWLYSAGAALMPPVVAVAIVLAVALVGYLLSIPWPDAKEAARPLARWTALGLGSAGLLAGLVLMVRNAVVGCTQAFRLDRTLGAAAATSGLLAISLVAAGCIGAFHGWGMTGGLIVSVLCVCAATAIAAVSIVKSQRAEGGA